MLSQPVAIWALDRARCSDGGSDVDPVGQQQVQKETLAVATARRGPTGCRWEASDKAKPEPSKGRRRARGGDPGPIAEGHDPTFPKTRLAPQPFLPFICRAPTEGGVAKW